MTPDDWMRAVSDAAAAWRDPDYAPREAAVKATLEAPNRFTEEGLAFALNHLMHQIRPNALRESVGARTAAARTVGIVCEAEAPLGGMSETLAAVLVGHRVVVHPAPESPALLPAFLGSVMEMADAEAIRIASLDALFADADRLVAAGDEDALDDLAARADAAGIPASDRWLRRRGFAVAVIDGAEDAETRSGLAEDLLLHEGIGPRAPAIVWAPAAHGPDMLLDTLAGFREVYPPHPDTEGSLRMPTAFLAGSKQPHATGPGFLLSKGEPDPQGPAHIRWSEYTALDAVAAWLRTHLEEVAFVVATDGVAERLGTDVPAVAPGDAHRPPLWERGLLSFLTAP